MVATPRVILPVAVLEGEIIPKALVERLSAAPVVLLGYEEIPEQTHPEQARGQFGEEASEALSALEETFEAHGATVETELVFTHDLADTVQEVVSNFDRSIVCHSNPVRDIDRVLVEVRYPDLVPAIAATTAVLVGPTEATITLHYAANEGEATDESAGERVLSGVSTTLEEAGVAPERISQVVEPATDPETTIIDRASDHDLIIIGEDEPSILNWIFGEMSERIAEETLAPVLVVQHPFEG